MRAEATASTFYSAEIDFDALIAAFPEEWAAWLEGDEPHTLSGIEKADFVDECAHEMGRDFFLPGSSWLRSATSEDDFEVFTRL